MCDQEGLCFTIYPSLNVLVYNEYDACFKTYTAINCANTLLQVISIRFV